MNKKLLSAVFTILICFSINAGEKDKGKTVGMVLVEGNETVSTFYICDHEVTQSEYKAVIGDNPSKFKGDKKPVERVSWYVAVEYCNALSIKEGLTPCYSKDSGENWTWNRSADGYRLPTEAEWEWAAKGGIKSKGYIYSGSDNIDSVAWYIDNSDSTTHPVKNKAPNELKLYDMTGNVWEWCWDWYGANYYKDNQVNPTGPKSGKMRVNRGGAFDSYGANGTIGYRSSDYPTRTFKNVGLRLVRNIPQE
jgi:formylglycine-generating enzyme required for sulfatase activity